MRLSRFTPHCTVVSDHDGARCDGKVTDRAGSYRRHQRVLCAAHDMAVKQLAEQARDRERGDAFNARRAAARREDEITVRAVFRGEGVAVA